MQAQIIGLSQQLSLVDGSTSHQIVIELPSGVTFHALVDDDVAQAVTEEFVSAGGAAVERAVQQAKQATVAAPPTRQVHPALAQAQQEFMSQREEPVEQEGDFAPMELEGTASGVSEFGGDFSLAAVGEQLRQAEASLAGAIADTDPDNPQEMQQAANRLRGIGDLPVPSWVGSASQKTQQPAQPQPMPKAATRRALRVGRDEVGNPIVQGPGVANHHALLGGTNVEAGDAGQL